MIFSHPKESKYIDPYILDFPVWKDAVWHIYLNADALEDIFTDLLELKEWESIYIKRDWNKYLCNIEWNTWYGFCTLSIWEALRKLLKFNPSSHV